MIVIGLTLIFIICWTAYYSSSVFFIQLKTPVCKLTVKMDCPSFKDTQVVLGAPVEESSINTKPSSQATSSTVTGVSLSGEWI